MRQKLSLTLIAAITAAGAYAATPATTAIPRSNTPDCLHREHRKAPARAAFNVTEADIIRDRPDGTEQLYSKACDYYTNTIFGSTQGSSTGMPCTVVEGSDGSFYIYDPFAGLDSKSWLRGEIEDDRLTIKLPQAIYADSDGENDYVYVAQMCYFQYTDPSQEEGLYYPFEGEQELIFIKEGECWVMQAPEEVENHPVVMGLVAADDATWCIYSDWNMRLTPFNEKTIDAPAGLATSEWVLSFPDENQEYLGGLPVQIGIDGSDIYMKGFSSTFPDAWIKGTVADGKATFESIQYLGADEMSNTFGYFYGATEEQIYNEEWDFWSSEISFADRLVFDIAPETGRYSSDGVLLCNKGLDAVNIIENFSKPRLQEQGEVTDLTPLDLVPGFYSEPGEWGGSVYFSFSNLNKEGQLLDTDNLYYRIFVDGEVFTLYSDEYDGIEDGAESIPFNFSNLNNIGYYGTAGITHFFYFTFTGFDSLAIQGYYLDGDKEYASAIVYIVNNEDDGVDAPESGNRLETSSEWFDLTGRRVLNPENGIYIKRVSYSDGSVRSYKETIR